MCLVTSNQASNLHWYWQQSRYTESGEKLGSVTQQCYQIPTSFCLSILLSGVSHHPYRHKLDSSNSKGYKSLHSWLEKSKRNSRNIPTRARKLVFRILLSILIALAWVMSLPLNQWLLEPGKKGAPPRNWKENWSFYQVKYEWKLRGYHSAHQRDKG